MIVYYFRTMSIFLGRMSIYLGKINQKLSTNFRKSHKLTHYKKYHETVETLDTVVVSTNLENYAQSVSRVLTVSCKNPHVSLVSIVSSFLVDIGVFNRC